MGFVRLEFKSGVFVRLAAVLCFASILVGSGTGFAQGAASQLADDAVRNAPREAEEEVPGEQSAPALNSAVERAVVQLSKDPIERVWSELMALVEAGNLGAMVEKVDALQDLKSKLGFTDLEDYSLSLLDRADDAAAAGDTSTTSFFVRHAVDLSPNSARVLVRAIPLAEYSSASVGDLGSRALEATLKSPGSLVGIIKSSIYPALWALTIAVYVGFILSFCGSIVELLNNVAQQFNPTRRGIITPLLVFALAVVPCFFGPLWCLFVWSCVVFRFLSSRKILGFLAGIVLVLWAALIPIRETLNVWLADNGIRTMLSIAQGSYGQKGFLQNMLTHRPHDGVLWYAYGQLLRKERSYNEASQAFLKAEELLSDADLAVAQRGLVRYLQRDYQGADKFFDEAGEQGLESPQYYFNYSKIKMDLLDTAASEELLSQARSGDEKLIDELIAKEAQLAEKGYPVLAEMNLPLSAFISSALLPIEGTAVTHDLIASAIMPGTKPTWILGLGVLLLLGSFMSASARRRRVGAYYPDYTQSGIFSGAAGLIPGGGWITGTRVLPGVMFLFAFTLLLMPLIGWPMDAEGVFSLLPSIRTTYLVCVGVLFVLGVVLSRLSPGEG